MSHIKKIEKGKYQVCVEAGIDPRTGQRRRKYKTVTGTKKEAEAVYSEMIARYGDGDFVESNGETIGGFLNTWIKNHKPNITESTYRDYKRVIKSHLMPSLGHIKLSDLKPYHVINYQQEKLENGMIRREGGLSKRSVQYHHSILRRALNDAVDWEQIEKNPATKVSAPKPDPKEKKTLTVEKAREILRISEGHYIYDFIYLAILTGMRRSEILGLYWSDINFEEGYIHVKRGMSVSDKEVIITQGTKNKEPRKIYILDKFKKLGKRLRGLHKENNENKLFFGEGYNDRWQFLLRHPNGDHHSPDEVSRIFKRKAKEAGITGVTFHSLRHTFATLMHKIGVDWKTIQEMLGHKRFETTMNIYTHVDEDQQRAAFEKYEEYLQL